MNVNINRRGCEILKMVKLIKQPTERGHWMSATGTLCVPGAFYSAATDKTNLRNGINTAADRSRDVYSHRAESRDSQLHFRRQPVNALDDLVAFDCTIANVISTNLLVVEPKNIFFQYRNILKLWLLSFKPNYDLCKSINKIPSSGIRSQHYSCEITALDEVYNIQYSV